MAPKAPVGGRAGLLATPPVGSPQGAFGPRAEALGRFVVSCVALCWNAREILGSGFEAFANPSAPAAAPPYAEGSQRALPEGRPSKDIVGGNVQPRRE